MEDVFAHQLSTFSVFVHRSEICRAGRDSVYLFYSNLFGKLSFIYSFIFFNLAAVVVLYILPALCRVFHLRLIRRRFTRRRNICLKEVTEEVENGGNEGSRFVFIVTFLLFFFIVFSFFASSFVYELFGSKQTASSSSSENIFSSIFPPPSKVRRGEFPKLEVEEGKQYHGEDSRNIEPSNPEDELKSNKNETQSEQKDANYIYEEQNLQPFPLSSSIFYGGQEIYSQPKDDHNSRLNPFPVDNSHGEDDSESASRGDWWQGSLYY